MFYFPDSECIDSNPELLSKCSHFKEDLFSTSKVSHRKKLRFGVFVLLIFNIFN